MELILFALGVLLGWAGGFLTSRYYYQKSKRDLLQLEEGVRNLSTDLPPLVPLIHEIDELLRNRPNQDELRRRLSRIDVAGIAKTVGELSTRILRFKEGDGRRRSDGGNQSNR